MDPTAVLFAEVITKNFKIPERFIWLKNIGKIKSIEMLKTFNCGIGLIIVVKNEESNKIISFLKKKKINSFILGKISRKIAEEKKVIIKSFGQWDLT